MIRAIAVVVLLCIQSTFADTSGLWRYRVLLDNKEIGYHNFEVEKNDGQLHVTSRAAFEIKVLFVTAFKYRHRLTEIWANDCLTMIDAKTVSNGKSQEVSGQLSGQTLELDSSRGTASLNECVQTFAYWNPSILNANKLLNPQTGDYVDVVVTGLGVDNLRLADDQIKARKFSIRSDIKADTNEPVDLTLWYGVDSSRWLALESVVKGGRILRYEPLQLPLPETGNAPIEHQSIAGLTPGELL